MTFSSEDISGTLVNYYGHCKRQAWLFNFGVRLESNSDYVRKGRYIDKKTFSRKDEVEIGGERLKIDFIDKTKIPIELHEVKASLRIREEHKLQIGFYLVRLKKKGIDSVGIIHYPEIKEKVTIRLSEINDYIEKVLVDLTNTMNDICPPRLPRNLCRGCAFFEFCYSVEEIEDV